MPEYSVINGRTGEKTKPLGICGSGIVSGVAAMVRSGLVEPSGRLIVGGTDRQYRLPAGFR